MNSRNNYRKCAKCGKTRAEDMTVPYHRFPNPGTLNVTKARAWAKYCWPTEDWNSLEFLKSLHVKNKVLCGRHFHSSQFYDDKRQKLNKFAVPDSTEVEELLNERENIFNENIKQSAVVSQRASKIPLTAIENIPSTSTQQSFLDVPSTSQSAFYEQNIKQSAVVSQRAYKMPLTPIENIPSTSTQQSFLDVPSTSQSAFYEQCPPTKVLASSSKMNIEDKEHALPSLPKEITTKRHGILKAINVTKISEMSSREMKLYNVCKKKLKEIIRLRNQLKKKKKINIIRKLSDDENVQKLCNLNISNSFVALLQGQIQNCPRKPKGRRYNLEQKIMALVIYKKSPACYRLLRRMFTLPSQSCLNKLLNQVPLKPGINKHLFKSLEKMAQKQTNEENICILLFDEMSIRKHLHYDVKLDQIQGFQDHGNHGRNNEIATKALVFMLTGLRKKWKQPIAFYFSHTLTADRMTVILKEILTECSNSNLHVVATVCDLSTVNIKVLKTLGATTREPYFSSCGREIVAILDPPHLLKCTRNLLIKHDVECITDFQCNNTTVKGIVKWSHIETFYNLDKNNVNFVYAPALTEQHIHPNVKQQMRVKLAAQVFSHSVAAGILAKIASNELPAEAHATAMFVQKFDELFDAVNADCPDLRRGKKHSTNLTTHSPHIALFGNMRKFISTMKYVGSKSNPPSQEGWIHTMNAIERLWQNLRTINIKSLSTRRLNQDPLENCFGCIRYNCGSNNNPTIQQFVGGVKTAIISNLRHSGQKKNCEDDTAILSNNLASFLKSSNLHSESSHLETNEITNEMEMLLLDAVEAVEQATPESQACAYVSGFIFKKLKHNACDDCRDAFLSKKSETIHIFTSFKEFGDKNSLTYVNKDAVKCIESIATIVNNYLKINGWKPLIKQNVMAALEAIDFSFLSKCSIHLEINKEHIKTTTFFICIKRFVILKNREMDEEEKTKAMERKMRILRNK